MVANKINVWLLLLLLWPAVITPINQWQNELFLFRNKNFFFILKFSLRANLPSIFRLYLVFSNNQ